MQQNDFLDVTCTWVDGHLVVAMFATGNLHSGTPSGSEEHMSRIACSPYPAAPRGQCAVTSPAPADNKKCIEKEIFDEGRVSLEMEAKESKMRGKEHRDCSPRCEIDQHFGKSQ